MPWRTQMRVNVSGFIPWSMIAWSSLVTVLLSDSAPAHAELGATYWCAIGSKDKTSWIVGVRPDQLEFNEAGVCEVQTVKRQDEWLVYTCIARDEAFEQKVSLRLSITQNGDLIFSSDNPELYDWVPRRLERCQK